MVKKERKMEEKEEEDKKKDKKEEKKIKVKKEKRKLEGDGEEEKEVHSKKQKLKDEKIERQKLRNALKKKEEELKVFHNQLKGVKLQSKKVYATVSIAVPGSMLYSETLPELQIHIVNQIARIAVNFHVNEVVVYYENKEEETAMEFDAPAFFAELLQYLETPPYLRKYLFKDLSPDMQHATEIVSPLDAPHHVTAENPIRFREGVVFHGTVREGEKASWVNVGLEKNVLVNTTLETNTRVTLKLDPTKKFGELVEPGVVKEQLGFTWGFTTRLANGLSEVLVNSPYPSGYDHIIRISGSGKKIQRSGPRIPTFNHMLIVFAGPEGLQSAAEKDPKLQGVEFEELFDNNYNPHPKHGCKSLRTQELVWITMSTFRAAIEELPGRKR